MKIIYVILIGLVVFNFTLIFTESLNLFHGPTFTGEEITGVNNESFTNMTAMDLLNVAVGGLNPVAAAATGVLFTVSILSSIVFRSPVPLGIGGFASVFTGIWIQTYSTLEQFPIPAYLLLGGTVGIGILFIINVIEMATGGHNG